MSKQSDNYQKSAATFIAVLFHSGTNAHFMHLQTKSYSVHKALQKYYEEIIDLVDSWAEAYQGKYSVIESYPTEFHVAKDPLQYMEQLDTFVETIRKALPKDSELQNLVDNVAELIDSTAYKLRNLK
jgi:DNA-binding ferritin-like protein